MTMSDKKSGLQGFNNYVGQPVIGEYVFEILKLCSLLFFSLFWYFTHL